MDAPNAIRVANESSLVPDKAKVGWPTHWDYRRRTYGAKLMTELAAEHGVSLGACLKGTRIDRESLNDPIAEITGHQEVDLVTNIIRALPGVPEIGLESGSQYHLPAYGIWGYALMSSPTVRDAVELGLRCVHLTYAFSKFEIAELPDRLRMWVDYGDIPGPARRVLVERDISAVFHMWEELLGEGPRLMPSGTP